VTGGKAAKEAAESRCELIELKLVDEPRGGLCAAEAFREVPFEIKRVYWVFGVPSGGQRAHHAHREQQELLVAARGEFTVHCDDGRVRSVHRLASPASGLLLPEMVWHHLDEFSAGALCLVFASGPYDYDEYVHDYTEFRELSASP
jgi:dTDP-4-dehydrorhamnose 3,5-epimerase-like enzyme